MTLADYIDRAKARPQITRQSFKNVDSTEPVNSDTGAKIRMPFDHGYFISNSTPRSLAILANPKVLMSLLRGFDPSTATAEIFISRLCSHKA